MAKKNDIGSWFEDELKQVFERSSRERRAFWHRFPDSKAARTLIGPQPSDFLFRQPNGESWFVEAKSSEVSKSLSQCFSTIRTTQISYAREWGYVGGPSAFVFFSDLSPNVEVWLGEQIVRHNTGEEKLKTPAFEFPYEQLYDRLMEILV